jgi:phosphoglycolate phosphatase
MSASTAGHPGYKAVIFDFDYTLADSSPGVIECMNYALRQMGLPQGSPEAIRAMIGVSLPATFEKLAGAQHGHRGGEFQEHFVARADQVMLQGIRLFDPVRPVVDTLLAAGIALGIVSTKFRYRIEDVLRRDGLQHAFKIVVGGEDVTAFKPDPTGLVTAVARLRSTPAEALFVGDSVVDAETAERAGVSFVAVLSGVTRREAFAAYPTRAIIEDLSLLPGLVL